MKPNIDLSEADSCRHATKKSLEQSLTNEESEFLDAAMKHHAALVVSAYSDAMKERQPCI